MFKRILALICCSFLAAGCALAPTRTPQFIAETFNDQIQKNIIVFTVIDARPDKTKAIGGRVTHPAQNTRHRLNSTVIG